MTEKLWPTAKHPVAIWNIYCDRYRNGVSAQQISRELSVSLPSVRYQLNKRGIVRRTVKEILEIKSKLANEQVKTGFKTCLVCKRTLYISEFYKIKTVLGGYSNRCIQCAKDCARRYVKTEDGKESHRLATEKYRKSPKWKTWYKKRVLVICRQPRTRFTGSRSRANRSGLGWTITWEQYSELISNPCTYCGGSLPETSGGLDRLDNSRGYDPDNVVPCCATCNYVRRDLFTPEEMKEFLGPVVRMIHERRRNRTT